VSEGPNVISTIVFWEVMLKVMKGTLLVGEPRSWWLDALDVLAATSLDLQADHVAKVFSLPPIHNDPFDRILIAQASVENLTLITTDKQIRRYATRHLRILT
jgi:PIN domain nuclease of toxin-antitoxin system